LAIVASCPYNAASAPGGTVTASSLALAAGDGAVSLCLHATRDRPKNNVM
jgi:hypothetical protein